ncbi:MAG: pyridoxal-phosphate dependent enzyme [Chloroflexi bacterium]|nr:pyridoxal-phosphate dependent enzyme [Chloroflexota bacterium]
MTPVRLYSPAELREHIGRVPRVRFAHVDTPLQPCPRLSAQVGVEILVKRDDLTGLAFGGNKTRNLEFRLAEAQQQGADVVVAALEVQSNSARQTTAAANLLGMRTVLLLHGPEPQGRPGNLLIDELLGAELYFEPAGDGATVERRLAEMVADLRASGHTPYVMNEARMFATASALAYLLAYLEIEEQLGQLGKIAGAIYMSSGSKGQAGLILGTRARRAATHVTGICARPDPGRVALTATIANAAAALIGLDIQVEAGEVDNDDRFARERDEDLTPGCFEAIRTCAHTEGLLLDPVYTGRAMEGLFAHIDAGRVAPGSTVVFVHTGGSPALFGFEAALRPYLQRSQA